MRVAAVLRAGRLMVNRAEKEIILVDIAVLSEHRGRGVGSRLILDLIAECQASRKALLLQVAKGNRAIHLYERLGFSNRGEDELYCRMRWEPTVDSGIDGAEIRSKTKSAASNH